MDRMRIVIVGAGPVGLFCSIALAGRRHQITVVDRDGGPPPRGPWMRKGVMQFHHAHTFRGQVVDALRAEMPGVLDDLLARGAEIAVGANGLPAALLCRRSTFERALRATATAHPNVVVHTGHVDRVVAENGRAVAITVGGNRVGADLIIDASGRASRFTRGLRPPAEGGDCGAVYVTRQYRLQPNAQRGPVNSPIGLSLSFPGYFAIAFLHDNHTFSVTINHDGSDPRLRGLRQEGVFETSVRAIPGLADWVDANRSHPITPVLPGGRLYNSYRGQLDQTGRPALPGLISVGDAVCTTTPLAGRGVALGLLQARSLAGAIERCGIDISSAADEFDAWCAANIKPWFADHVVADADRMRRWSGGDVDVSRRLPSDLIVAAAAADSSVRAVVEPYAQMTALPDSLLAAEPRARQLYASGWRPPVPPGPSRDELAAICAERAA
ncbi:FAD-dependent oxidoreductase [Mycobacterium sp. LTG2003]